MREGRSQKSAWKTRAAGDNNPPWPDPGAGSEMSERVFFLSSWSPSGCAKISTVRFDASQTHHSDSLSCAVLSGVDAASCGGETAVFHGTKFLLIYLIVTKCK